MKPKLRLSLRLLLLLVAISAIGLAWWADRAHRQRDVVAMVRRLGGHVVYDFQHDGNMGSKNPQRTPPAPEWLRSALGDDFFSDVKMVMFDRTTPTSECLRQLAALKGLRTMTFADRGMRVADLKCLHDLPHLEQLFLGGTKIIDANLPELERLRHLKVLNFRSSKMSPEDLARLRQALPGTLINR